MLRPAVPGDAAALLAIYGQYIDTSITFEYELPSPEEFRGRIAHISAFYPYLVCEENGVVLGYAYAHRYRERAAYQWSAELSVYLDRNARGRGIGPRLYSAILDLLRLQNIRMAFTLVTIPNEPSDRFHLAMGFQVAGVTHNAGFKNGAWRGVTVYEKPLSVCDAPPEPLKSIHDLDPAAVRAILTKYGEEKP